MLTHITIFECNENMHQLPIMLTERVTNLLSAIELPATLTIEQCATQLTMSMTTFRRKLAQEETSYKLIQSKFLNELCVNALLTNRVRIEDLAIKLGYSERATFERAFRNKFGITPSQFRELSLASNNKYNHQNLAQIAQNIPPLSGSCQQLLLEKDRNSLNIKSATEIIEKDAIYSARIMGLASKAIYGKTPKCIHEAISRNLGLNTVVNLAVIYAVKDTLQDHVDPVIINQYTQTIILAPKFFQLIRNSRSIDTKFSITLTEQVLVFALLGVFLLSHNNTYNHQLMLHSLQGFDDLQSLNNYIHESMKISIYSASSLMLSLWHIDASLIKQLTHLDKVSLKLKRGNEQDELILFMLSCLYVSATKRQNFKVLERKATFLNINNFTEIKALLFSVG